MVKKILHYQKKLPQHLNAQSWMLNQSIMDLGLDEIQVIKYPFVFQWKQHMNHGNIYQFHIL
jgi:hypothetical protein